VKLQNRQNGSPIYQSYPFGLLTFKTAGKHTVAVRLVEEKREQASLESIRLMRAE
jgi:alpha-L-fucosidase